MPLSVTTAPPTVRKVPPYDDELGTDGFLAYRYRGSDPNHRDNVGLRLAPERHTPLGYFFSTLESFKTSWYEAIWPVYVVEITHVSLYARRRATEAQSQHPRHEVQGRRH